MFKPYGYSGNLIHCIRKTINCYYNTREIFSYVTCTYFSLFKDFIIGSVQYLKKMLASHVTTIRNNCVKSV